MKRLLLLLPLLLLLTPAAQAIDYVKCEAMQKAAERASSAAFDAYRAAHYEAEKQFGLSKARAIAEADPAYKKAEQRLNRIQADYDAEDCY